MINNKFFNGIKKILDQNAPTLATFGSILGVVGTIYFMHKAAKQASDVVTDYEEDLNALNDLKEVEHMSEEELKHEKARLKINKNIQLVYIYRWALLSGIGSAGFAILSNYLNGRTIAALTGFLALNNEKLKEYAVKGKEMLGEEKFKKLQENVERDILGKKIENGEIKAEKAKIIAKEDSEPAEGLTRFYVPWTGDMWDIPVSQVKDAINEAQRTEFLDWNTFRNMLGIESAPVWYKYCWTKDNPFKAHIGYVNVGIGGMKAICLDTQPIENKWGK